MATSPPTRHSVFRTRARCWENAGLSFRGSRVEKKAQSASGERLVQVVQKQPAEQARQNPDW